MLLLAGTFIFNKAFVTTTGIFYYLKFGSNSALVRRQMNPIRSTANPIGWSKYIMHVYVIFLFIYFSRESITLLT